jgi:hypothetical protein
LIHAAGDKVIEPALVIGQEEPDQRCPGNERLVVAAIDQFILDALVGNLNN